MANFKIDILGEPKLESSIILADISNFVSDSERIILEPLINVKNREQFDYDNSHSSSFEIAGPRAKIYFSPNRTKVGIVTCGGLCPGINAVIRALVLHLWYRYEVKNIIGIPYGYQGFSRTSKYSFIEMNPELVEDIHEQGGTIIGSSRGTPPVAEIVDALEKYNINILFTIGGDGTLRGADELYEEIKSRNLKISIIGIPKTIDNDIPYVKQSFGFESAVGVACQTVIAAHEEARGARRGIGLVRIMGRHSGYIAANTTLATGHVNLCLVPESDFSLKGKGGVLDWLEKRLEEKDHAVIIVAEGAGQYFFKGKGFGQDASGNLKLGDIGPYLKEKITEYFKAKKNPVTLRYIDPSYIIRSTPANSSDRLFCATLAQNAAHAAMAGKTGMLIGYWHGVMTHVPFKALKGKSQTINPKGKLWFNVLETTGQPFDLGSGEDVG